MKIIVEGRTHGQWTFYNVSLASSEGKEPFMTIKDVRIIEGSKGPFLSFPARKDDAGKFWPHVWANDQFQSAVIAEARKAAPQRTHSEMRRSQRDDDLGDIPFN